jgi:hypothetical protein
MVLLPGQAFSILDGKRSSFTVLEGAVWLTQENDLRDLRVRAGESASLDRPGRAVLQAERSGPARISLQAL